MGGGERKILRPGRMQALTRTQAGDYEGFASGPEGLFDRLFDRLLDRLLDIHVYMDVYIVLDEMIASFTLPYALGAYMSVYSPEADLLGQLVRQRPVLVAAFLKCLL